MKTWRAAVASFVVALAACGGNGETPPSVQGIVNRLAAQGVECRNLKIDGGQRELGSREQGTCQLGDEYLHVHVHNSNDARDAANKIALQFGGIAVLGDRWTIRTDTEATARRVQAAIGGKVT